ncbi:MAG: hypothetical protein BroJett003_20750 [Planctomycetota bacterium]|nr:MAG: hypothetical protein BroJett003_20750 [Planctomycetota bacterium]
MRAWVLILLTVVAVTLQGVVAPRFQWGAARPDFPLMLAAFLSLHASRPVRLCGGWIVGLALDVTSIEPVGVFTVSYGLAGLTLAVVRDRVFIYHVAVQIALVVTAGAVLSAVLLLYRGFAWSGTLGGFAAEFWAAATSTLYTACAAPLVFYPLLWGAKGLGIPAPGYRARQGAP